VTLGTRSPVTPESEAYTAVDGVVTLATKRAHRSVGFALAGWIVPFFALSTAVPVGDYLDPGQLFGTMICTGVQSVILVGVTLVLVALWLARRSRGRPGLRSMLTVAGVFLALGSSLRVFDGFVTSKSPPGLTDFPPLHHCFTASASSAGAGLAVLSLGARSLGSGFLRWQWRAHLVALVAAGVLAALVLWRSTSYTVGQMWPVAIWYGSFRVAPLVGYPSFLWIAAGRWGVDVAPTPPEQDSSVLGRGCQRRTTSASAAVETRVAAEEVPEGGRAPAAPVAA